MCARFGREASYRRQPVDGFSGDSPPLGSRGYTSKFHVDWQSCTSQKSFTEKLELTRGVSSPVAKS